MHSNDVLIIGAGIGGLTLALALQRAGIRVAIYEQVPELTEIGAGLTVASNGTAVLQHLGLGPAMQEFAVSPQRGAMKHYSNGKVLVDIPRGDTQIKKYGAPYCQMHRADLQQALLESVLSNDPNCIHLEHTLVDLSQTGSGVTAKFSNGNTIAAEILVGCDGIKSTVRARLFGAEEPGFTGYVAWRGLVPMESLPEGLLDPDSAIFIGPGHFFTRYRVSAGKLLNYVATARTDNWSEEGWTVPSTVAAVMQEFDAFHLDIKTILAATPPDECYKWGIFDRDPLPSWTIGRATLLGDAAHPMTPFLGQGAVMAIEDAMVFSRALQTSGSMIDGIQQYENARRERTAFVFEESRLSGERLTTFDPDAYDSNVHRNEETLDLAAYDAVTVPI
jgi:salicylate hydroxylase